MGEFTVLYCLRYTERAVIRTKILLQPNRGGTSLGVFWGTYAPTCRGTPLGKKTLLMGIIGLAVFT